MKRPTEKKVEMLNNTVTNTIKRFAVKGRFKLIGSNALRSTLYGSDYDVEDYLKDQTPAAIARHFQEAFKNKDPSIFIVDFKCGLDSQFVYGSEDYSPSSIKAYLQKVGLPKKEKEAILNARGDEQIEKIRDLFILRWKPSEIEAGYKVLRNGTKKSLEECLMDKTILKIDIIQLVGDQFCEISENYYIELKNGDKNYEKKQSKKEIQKALEEDIRFFAPTNSFKALKRLFSLFLIEGKKREEEVEKMTEFFNGQVGYLNKIRSELDILEKVIPYAKWKDVENNIQFIKEQLSTVFEIPFDNRVFREIDDITEKTALRDVITLKDYFLKKVNEYSKDFLANYLRVK